VDGLAWCTANGADRKRLWSILGATVIASSHALFNDLNLPVEARRAALDQWYVRREAHLVDVASRIEVVERIEHQVESPKPFDSELAVFDICVICGDLGVGVELLCNFLRNLRKMNQVNIPRWVGAITDRMEAYQRLRLLDVFVSEEELSVKVREIDRVEVNDVDVAEAAED
jgi:hypothetical protein